MLDINPLCGCSLICVSRSECSWEEILNLGNEGLLTKRKGKEDEKNLNVYIYDPSKKCGVTFKNNCFINNSLTMGSASKVLL